MSNELKSLFGASFALASVVAGCGISENNNLPKLSNQKPQNEPTRHNGEDNQALRLSSGSQFKIWAIQDPWFVSKSDGSPINTNTDMPYRLDNSYRPENMDQYLAAFVSIEDKESQQKCSGSVIMEDGANGKKNIFILTAAHCFSKNDKIGRKLLSVNRNVNFSTWNYPAQVLTNKGSVTTHYRIFQKSDSTKTDYSDKKIFQLGRGDVIKIQIAENVDAGAWSSKSIPVCANDSALKPTRSSASARLMLGSKAWTEASLSTPEEILTYRRMYEGRAILGGVGNGPVNGDGMYNLRIDILDHLNRAATNFKAQEDRYDLPAVAEQVAAGKLPAPTLSESAQLYSFTDLGTFTGVGAGDSGLPVIDFEQRFVTVSGTVIPVVKKLNCVSGVLVREFWDNPHGSAGAGEFRSQGGFGTGVNSTSIIQPVTASTTQGMWKQVYPLDINAKQYLVLAEGTQSGGKKESHSQKIISTDGVSSARQACVQLLSKFVRWEPPYEAMQVSCKLHPLDSMGKVQQGREERVDDYSLPASFGR